MLERSVYEMLPVCSGVNGRSGVVRYGNRLLCGMETVRIDECPCLGTNHNNNEPIWNVQRYFCLRSRRSTNKP